MIITIDGPAGTGKTTIAKIVAERLGFFYFDTGAMYRAVTYCLLRDQIDLSDKENIKKILKEFRFFIRPVKKQNRYFVGNEDVTEVIRSPEVTKKVSAVSALGEVREYLVNIQRHFGNEGNSVFEGRDMGTMVFPDAELKIFLTARPAVRAERRYLEVKNNSNGLTQEEIFQQIMERDHLDSTRENSPLKQAKNAHLIDTSDMTIEEVVDKILTLRR